MTPTTTTPATVPHVPVTNYLTILPGQTQIIKKSAKILSILNNGGVNYTSSCGTLPAPSPFQCYEMHWATLDTNSSGTQPYDITDGFIVKYLFIAGVKHTLPVVANSFTAQHLVDYITANNMPFMLNMVSTEAAPGLSANFIGGRERKILFKTAASIGDNMYIEIAAAGTSNFRIYPVAYDCPAS